MVQGMATPRDMALAITATLELSAVRRLTRSGEAQRLRELGYLTQMDIARTIGVTGATVSCWESGKHRPTGPAALAYGRLLYAIAESNRGDDDETS
jgi:DNA-binding transcriptional regulator YiaG